MNRLRIQITPHLMETTSTTDGTTESPSEAPPGPRYVPVAQDNGTRAWIDSLSRQHGFERLEVEGILPEELAGTLYRTGPAVFEIFGERYGHWFDGDGAISAVRIENGRAFGAVRLMDTAGLRRERRHGRRIYGGYGTAPKRSLRVPFGGRAKNTANIAALAWSGRVLSLWEAGRPHEVDPQSLSTVGETDLGGVIRGAFSAHPHRVAELDAIFNFGLTYSAKSTLDLYALRSKGRAEHLSRLTPRRPYMIHDFIATTKHLVFFCPPLWLDIKRAALNLGIYEENLRWRPHEGTEVLIVPLDEPDRPISFQTDAFFQWHFVNAYEDGAEIVVDFIHYDAFRPSSQWLRSFLHKTPRVNIQGVPKRARIDPTRQSVRLEDVGEFVGEFPKTNPRTAGARHRHFWMASHSDPGGDKDGLWDGLAKIDPETGKSERIMIGDGQHSSEPVFVPRPNGTDEDDGWLLVACYDVPSARSFVAVLDARTPSRPPLARLWFTHHIPMAFHGDFDQRR